MHFIPWKEEILFYTHFPYREYPFFPTFFQCIMFSRTCGWAVVTVSEEERGGGSLGGVTGWVIAEGNIRKCQCCVRVE